MDDVRDDYGWRSLPDRQSTMRGAAVTQLGPSDDVDDVPQLYTCTRVGCWLYLDPVEKFGYHCDACGADLLRWPVCAEDMP